MNSNRRMEVYGRQNRSYGAWFTARQWRRIEHKHRTHNLRLLRKHDAQ